VNVHATTEELGRVERALGAAHSEDVLVMLHALDVEGLAALARILVVAGHIFRQRPSLAVAAGFDPVEGPVSVQDAPGIFHVEQSAGRASDAR